MGKDVIRAGQDESYTRLTRDSETEFIGELGEKTLDEGALADSRGAGEDKRTEKIRAYCGHEGCVEKFEKASVTGVT